MTIFYLILYLVILGLLIIMNMNLVAIRDQLEFMNECISCIEDSEEGE